VPDLNGAAMPTIAISYRREDTRWIVGRIFDRLVEHYGHGSIFMDIDGVPLGFDFRDQIQNTLQRSDVLIAVIGPQWLAIQKETGRSRLEDETDWVRIEIEAALGKKIPVIPVLIDRTPLPKPSELPDPLRAFAYRQATNIDAGVDFQTHMDRLIRAIDQLLDGQSDTTRDAEPKTNRVRLLDNRSSATLLGNGKNTLNKAQRSKISDWQMPLIREIVGDISEWVIRQANIWLQVIKSPKDFVSAIDLASGDEFGKSLQFLFFVVICNQILSVPINAIYLHLHTYDPTVVITGLITGAIDGVMWGTATWLFGRVMKGKGQYRNVLVAGFYSTAFTPFFTIYLYLSGYSKQEVLNPFIDDPNGDPVRANIAGPVGIVLVVYIAIKLVPLIRFIHSIGVIRASIVYGLTFAVSCLYELYVSDKFLAELLKSIS
jgi:hypothetical protein